MPILFLDLDGTVRESKSGSPFINNPKDQQLIEGVKAAITHYRSKGWMLIGVTNQGGVASGHKSFEDCCKEQRHTLEIANLDCIYFCPTYDGLECWKIEDNFHLVPKLIKQESIEEFGSFRKPGCGMLRLPLQKYGFAARDCWLVGDRPEDKLAATAACVNFCPADVWRNRFCNGIQEFRDVTLEQVKFLEGSFNP